MPDLNIFRKPTDREEADFIDVGPYRKKGAKEWFMEKIAEKEKEYYTKMLPYCRPCARYDFDDMIKNLVKEEDRKIGKDIDWSKIARKDIDFDFDKYGETDRFIQGKDNEAKERTIVGMSHIMKLIGYHRDFICKIRGCGNSIFIPIEQYEQMNAKVKK